MHAEFMRLRPGQGLHDGQQPVEPGAGYPLLVFHQLAPDHGDLGYGSAEREDAEPEEAQEQSRIRQIRRTVINILGHALDDASLAPARQPPSRHSRITPLWSAPGGLIT